MRVLSANHWTAREFPGTTFPVTDFLPWQNGQGWGSYPHPASLGLGKLAPLVLPGPPLCPCPVHLVSSDVRIQHISSPYRAGTLEPDDHSGTESNFPRGSDHGALGGTPFCWHPRGALAPAGSLKGLETSRPCNITLVLLLQG